MEDGFENRRMVIVLADSRRLFCELQLREAHSQRLRYSSPRASSAWVFKCYEQSACLVGGNSYDMIVDTHVYICTLCSLMCIVSPVISVSLEAHVAHASWCASEIGCIIEVRDRAYRDGFLRAPGPEPCTHTVSVSRPAPRNTMPALAAVPHNGWRHSQVRGSTVRTR